MKTEYAEEVAAKIIEQLEQGTAPWQRPWKPGELALPYNAATGKEYRGMNSIWLAMQGHSDPRWMTFNQAIAAEAGVRRGSKGTKIMYWKFREERKATDEQGRPILDENGKPRMVTVELERPRAFHAVVFNGQQIDGLPALQPKQIATEPERHARAEAILANSGASIRHAAGDRAFYQPSTDSITLPERSQFQAADGYYATALHELGHWTGHASRLDRDLAHPFGSEGYAREELRAEIASLMLGERLEIGHDPGQHAAYVKSWIKALKDDPREIFRAASDAERITTYISDFEQERIQTQAQSASPDAAIEWLQRLHHNAVPGYSPLESWQMMQAEAERHGFAARISEDSSAFVITYTDREGGSTSIRTDLFGDGKMFTSYDGRRLSAFISNDEDSQPGYLRQAIELHDDAKKERQGKATADHAVRHERPEDPMPSRTYLAVPYAEKDEAKAIAKAAGVKLAWDKEAKAWWVPESADLAALGRWRTDAIRVQTPTSRSAQEQFADALKAEGLVLDGMPVMDGKIHRVPVQDDRHGETSGAYAGHLEGRIPGGFIQNHRTGERINWRAEGTIDQATPQERSRLAAEAAQRQQHRDAETLAKHEATAQVAALLWAEAAPATAANAYCTAKGIADPVGLRVVPEAVSAQAAASGIQIARTAMDAKAMRDADPAARVFKAGDLLIPGRDAEGKLWTLQSVNPSFKSFMKGGRKHGLFTIAGTDPERAEPLGALSRDGKPLMLAEGFATADAVARMASQPVVVAFDAGNLDAVAGELRGRFPARMMLIAADNDHDAARDLAPGGNPLANVGLEKAQAAAERHGAGVAVPLFKDGEKGSDWNDLRALRGEETARKMLAEQFAIARRDAAISAERLTTLAHEREQEARNDPTTSADDARVAAERGRAAEMIATASEQEGAVRGAVADGIVDGQDGAPAMSSIKAGIDRKTETMHDEAGRERQDVQNHAHVLDSATRNDQTPVPAKTPRQRPRIWGQGVDL